MCTILPCLMKGGFISVSLHHPFSPNSLAPEVKTRGQPDDRVPATVPCHNEVFFLESIFMKRILNNKIVHL